eukprot:COSAG04_NODE_6542_length_1308_cov_1.110008_1_plen_68_part_10
MDWFVDQPVQLCKVIRWQFSVTPALCDSIIGSLRRRAAARPQHSPPPPRPPPPRLRGHNLPPVPEQHR